MKNYNKLFQKLIQKDKYTLNLSTWYDTQSMIDNNSYNEQEIIYKDYTFCLIRNYESIRYESDYAHHPYCIKNNIFGYIITVPKFKQLTDKDISKAIFYIARQMNMCMLFNVTLDKKLINHECRPDYQSDTCTLRWMKELNKENL